MDTWMGNNQDPVTLHKYLYANANPVNGIDPSGNMTLLGQMSTITANQILGTVAIVSTYQVGQSLTHTNSEGGYDAVQTGWLVLAGMSGAGSKLYNLINSKLDENDGNDETKDLSRAVEDGELASLYLEGGFAPSPGGFGVKQFFNTEPEAVTYGLRSVKRNINKTGGFHIVNVTISESMYSILDHEGYEADIGPIVSVPNGLLPAFNLDMNRYGGFRYSGRY